VGEPDVRQGVRLALYRSPALRISMTKTGISIELSKAQVNEVVRGVAGERGVSDLLRGLQDQQTFSARYRTLADSPRHSRSLLLGLLVLTCFPSDGTELAVTDVAQQIEMSPSTTHRYMTTLLAVGLLEQDPRTRGYHRPGTG
jgi:IclR helix-turn-helix domain